jgi:Zn-dependent protease/CBS domain-containing protein
MTEALFVILVFTCVLLHELGHALVAKGCGIQTRDITLYPFGGIAAIVQQPGPRAELAIALAGPVVNVVIALCLYPFVTLPDLSQQEPLQVSLLARIFLTNVALATFNMLPALPMDGGRVLRATLSLLRVRNATAIAARVSQGLCLILAAVAMYFEQPMLFIIALLVFLGAMQEHVRSEARIIAASFMVKDAMIPRERLEFFPHGTTVSSALRTALTSWQPIFPVVSNDALMGIITRDDILSHSAQHADDYVGEIMRRPLPAIDHAAALQEAVSLMESSAADVLVVTQDERYVGLLAHDRLSEFLFMNEIRKKLPKDDDVEWQTPL